MNYQLKVSRMVSLVIVCLSLSVVAPSKTYAAAEHAHDQDDHPEPTQGPGPADDHGHEEEEHGEQAQVILTPAQLSMAGIVIKAIELQSLNRQINAPGEVVNNQYQTTHIAPKITAQVVKRNVVLGEEVSAGTPLLTLFSVELLQAQTELLVAFKEWQRVKKLGEQTVGAKRFTEVKAVYEELTNKVAAYGMTQTEIQASLIGKHDDHELGEFDLTAPHPGVVLSDDFSLGQTVESGRTLIKLVDESTVWVEAFLPPDIGFRLPKNTATLVNIQGSVFEGHVIQQSHLIDEATRTWKVRILIDNPDHILHAGLFANVIFTLRSDSPALVVPDSALVRVSDGDWTVFVEGKPGQFTQTEVEVVSSSPGLKAITGLQEHTRIAVEGAFFIASEIAKSGFDPHDH